MPTLLFGKFPPTIHTEDLIKLSEKFDELYKRAVEFNKKYNPCGFGKVIKFCKGCGKIAQPNKRGKYETHKTCCNGCKHLGPDGCKVEALTCRLWFCQFVNLNKLPPEARDELNYLWNELHKLNLGTTRGSKLEHLKTAIFTREFLKHI